MDRPSQFEEQRFVGDKRSQVVYDLDGEVDQAVIDGMQAAANLAVGDKLGAMANVNEMMDELGIAQAIGNPAAFSQVERDLSGFLSL